MLVRESFTLTRLESWRCLDWISSPTCWKMTYSFICLVSSASSFGRFFSVEVIFKNMKRVVGGEIEVVV